MPSVVQVAGPSTDPSIPSINFVSGPSNMTSVGSTLYYTADVGHGTELWRTAGKPGDSVPVQGGDPVPTSGYVSNPVKVGNWLYFLTDNGNGSYTLWRNDSSSDAVNPDGTSKSQQMQLSGIATDPGGVGPYQLTAVGDDLYFGAWSPSANGGAGAWELWKVAGASAQSGAIPNATVLPSNVDSNGPSALQAVGTNLYFTADAPDGSGTSVLWWYNDGMPNGPAPVEDRAGDYVPSVSGNAPGDDQIAVGSDLYQIVDNTLWRITGGTGTAIASVGAPTGSPDASPSYFMTVAGDSLYFLTSGDSYGQYALWKCEGSTASEVWQSPTPLSTAQSQFFPLQMAAVGSDVYFTDYAHGGPRDLWMSNGTREGTQVMKSFEMGSGVGGYTNANAIPTGLTPVGSTLYFEGPDGRLWQSGGTPETTNSTTSPLNGNADAMNTSFFDSTHSEEDSPSLYSPFAAVGSTLYIGPPPFDGVGGPLWRLNNPPVANADAYTAVQDSLLTVSAAAGVLANDTNAADAGYLTASVVSGPTNAQSFTLNPDGSFTYAPKAGYVGPDSFTYQVSDGSDPPTDAIVSLTVQSLHDFLQAAVNTGTANVPPIQATPTTVGDVVSAIESVTVPQNQSVNVYLNLASGTYSPQTVQVPAGMTLYINGVPGTVIDPDSPAFTVASGNVVVSNVHFTTSGDAPTILVTGGNLTLLNDDVTQTSTAYSDPAIAVTGGTVNLGTAATPGNNTLSVNSSSSLVSNSSGLPISAVGNTFIAGGTTLPPLTLSFTSISTSATTTVYGQAVTFTATVQPDGGGTPSGTVDFVDTSTNADLGRVALSNGSASLTTSALTAGSHGIKAIYSGDSTFLASNTTLTQAVAKATPAFSLTAPPTAISGTSTTQISGSITAGTLVPTGSVTVTVNGVSKSAAINTDGTFSVVMQNSALGAGSYTISYSYAGDNNFTSATASATMNVTNGVLALFNQGQSKHAGSTIPVQIELVSSSGQDLTSGATITAVGMAATTDTTDTVGSIDPSKVGTLQSVQSANNANPGNVFRTQGGANPFAMYNLQTPTNLAAGTSKLFAQAKDSDGVFGGPFGLTVTLV